MTTDLSDDSSSALHGGNPLVDLLKSAREYCAMFVPDEIPSYVEIMLQGGEIIRHPLPRVALAARHHSVDFRSVVWDGIPYALTGTQAAIVAILWAEWQAGTPEVSQAALLEGVGSLTARVRELFRGSPAWGTLIVSGSRKGTLKLNV